MNEHPPILTIEDATLGYGRKVVLKEVDFSMERGDFTALLGPNGSGKTTLLKAILGEIKPQAGRVSLAEGVRLGYAPQIDTEGTFWPLKVRNFVRLFARNAKNNVDNALKSVGITDLASKNMQELSGGQRRKALLAKALANTPELLILDEPTHGMDVASEADYLELLRQLNREDMSIILVTHLLYVALSVAKNILIVQDGRATPTTVDAIIEQPILEGIYNRSFESGRIGNTPVIVPSRS
jgi:zinc transport system ATP-binding protein